MQRLSGALHYPLHAYRKFMSSPGGTIRAIPIVTVRTVIHLFVLSAPPNGWDILI